MRGSVVQKPKGTEQWYVVLDLEGQPAARRRKWHSGCRSKTRRGEWPDRLVVASDSGTSVELQRLTLGEILADRWVPDVLWPACTSCCQGTTVKGNSSVLRRPDRCLAQRWSDHSPGLRSRDRSEPAWVG